MTVTTHGREPGQAVLSRADGVELIGEMAGSGYRVPPSLARRADGQTIQLTPLLYAILREIDGERSSADVAAAVSASTGRTVSADNVDHLVAEQLRPLGLLVRADGTQPVLKKRNPLLGLRFRYAVTDPDRTRRITDPFRFLFRPWVVIPMLAAFAAVCWWVFLHKGLASAAYDAFERPGLLILVFAVTILSAGFHEFGHAAAARYGGSTPGVMGVGLYLVWPAFYTDVTDSYRLGRGGRVRTDLGGLYFNAIVAVAITAVWWWLRYDALLLVVATQILQMLRQLAPMVRFDGYHVLADLTGVPDLYSRIKPTLLGALPWRWGDPGARLLKPWARILVTCWVIVVIPLLLSALAAAVIALPRLVGTAWSSLGKQQDVLVAAWSEGDMIQATARVLAMVAIVIPVAGVVYMLVRLVRRSTAAALAGTEGKPVKRILVAALGVAIVGAVGYAWLPREDNYRPIQPDERGTIGDIVYALDSDRMAEPVTGDVQPRAVSVPTLVKGQQGVLQTVWDANTPRPVQRAPELAVILVPKAPQAAAGGGGGGFRSAAAPADQGWVFPVDKPLAPGPGDTQALAVNTTDGTTEYEAAFALVWATDETDAMNVNEAQAYASCTSCSAVAVAFQVVFVIDGDEAGDNVVAPQNLAGALNYDCVNCLTYALARQLFVTLDEPLSEAAMAELDVLWTEIAAYGEAIEAGEVPPEEIEAQLDAYEREIKAIVEADQPGTFPTATATNTPSTESPSVTVSPSTAASAAPTAPSEPATDQASTDGSTTNGPTASAEPTADPTATNEVTAPTGSTPTGTVTDGSTTTGSTTDGSTSGGSTSDGSGSSGTDSGDGSSSSP
jgi:putative peptide zinc metalloprotease protein